jgi:hypothetical protein
MYLVDLFFWSFVSWMCMIFGGDVHFCIISMIPCRPVLMCPMFHVIMVREVIVGLMRFMVVNFGLFMVR